MSCMYGGPATKTRKTAVTYLNYGNKMQCIIFLDQESKSDSEIESHGF